MGSLVTVVSMVAACKRSHVSMGWEIVLSGRMVTPRKCSSDSGCFEVEGCSMCSGMAGVDGVSPIWVKDSFVCLPTGTVHIGSWQPSFLSLLSVLGPGDFGDE